MLGFFKNIYFYKMNLLRFFSERLYQFVDLAIYEAVSHCKNKQIFGNLTEENFSSL